MSTNRLQFKSLDSSITMIKKNTFLGITSDLLINNTTFT